MTPRSFTTRIRQTCLAAVLAACNPIPAYAQATEPQIVEQPLRIPMPQAGKAGLEAIIVRPDDSNSHPLALLAHGSPRDSSDRAEMSAWNLLPQAREFARRGWTAVAVMRRGYGTSGGSFSEDARSCSSHADYYDAGRESTKDLRAAIAYLSTLPQVDASRIISVGVSAGGFATVALAADPPPGLVAAISFAGGRGSKRPDEVCNPDALIRAVGKFGQTARIPMLWVYSQNDHFFGPQLAVLFYKAFRQSGGVASFIQPAAFGNDGHHLFSLPGIPVWTPMVDEFLSAQNLKLRDTSLPLPTPPDVSPPGQLSEAGRREFRTYLTFPEHKAFAVSPSGHYGYSFGRSTDKEAQKLARDRCSDVAPRGERCEFFLNASTP